MGAIDFIYKRLRDFRKKHLLTLTPEQEKELRDIAHKAYEEGKEIGIQIASESISKTLTDLSKKNM